MGAIADLFNTIYRDFAADGVSSSGLYEPLKSEIRSIGTVIEAAIGAGSVGALVSLTHATRAELDADLDHDADTVALVYADATEANNELYVKTGSSGSGSWTRTTAIHDAIRALALGYADQAQAWAESATPPDPDDATSKSAKSWAAAAQAAIDAVSNVLARTTEAAAAAESGGFVNWQTRAALGSFSPIGSFYAWSAAFDAGADIAANVAVDAVVLPLRIAAAATHVQVKMYSRPLSDTGGAGPTGGDTLLSTTLVSAAALGLTPGGADLQTVTVALSASFVTDAAKTYLVQVQALDGSNAPQNLTVGDYNPGTSQRRRGYYSGTSIIAWSNIAAGHAAVIMLARKGYVDASDLKAQADANTAIANTVDASFDKGVKAIGQRPQTAFFAMTGTNFGACGFGLVTGADIALGAKYRFVSLYIQAGPAATYFKLRHYRRPAANSLSAAPAQAGDTLIETVTRTLAQLGLEAGGMAGWAQFPLGAEVTASATDYDYFVAEAYDATDTRTLQAMGYNASSPGTAGTGGIVQFSKGWYKPVPQAIEAYSNIGSTWGLSWTVGRDAYVVAASAGSGQEATTRDIVTACSITVSGLNVTVDATKSVLDRQGLGTAFGGTVALTGAATGSVSAEARTLRYANSGSTHFAFVDAAGRLANGNVSSVVVKDAGTSATLVLNTDYSLDTTFGTIARRSAGSDVAVNVDYSYARTKYASLWLDPETLTLSVTYGADRNRDAQEAQAAAASTRAIELARFRIVGGVVTDMIQRWYVYDGGRRALANQAAVDLTRNRAALSKTRRRLMRGQQLKIAIYSDSIGAHQNANPTATTPNGSARDRAVSSGGYFMEGVLGSDITSAMPLYTAVQNGWSDDVAGSVHTRESFAWKAVIELARVYGLTIGTDIVLDNWGVGGTDLSSTTGNALDPARYGAMVAGGYHLIINHFGTNNPTASTNEANYTTLVAAELASGAEVIMCGVPRPNSSNSNIGNFPSINRICRRVAEAKGVAFADFMAQIADENMGVMGLAGRDYAGANLYNHPGPADIAVMARAVLGPLLP